MINKTKIKKWIRNKYKLKLNDLEKEFKKLNKKNCKKAYKNQKLIKNLDFKKGK